LDALDLFHLDGKTVVIFLASPYFAGQTVVVDGGATAW